MSLGSQREHGHTHKSIAPLLRSYDAQHVPEPSGQWWVSMRCPFHDDGSASAQTDGVGFRCFTCDVFYPAPITLLMQREGLNLDDAHDRYHSVTGTSGSEVPGQHRLGSDIPERTRHRTGSRRSGQVGRRRRP